jgi:Gpi18-like mannosyltransferase
VIKKRPWLFGSIGLFVLSLVLRYWMRNWTNDDTTWMGGWYAYLVQHGWRGLADPTFSNYTPAYLYLLWFSTRFSDKFNYIIALKIIPTLFDLISMVCIFLLARLRYKRDEPYVFAAAFFLLPTVMVNSSGWGQIDDMYTSFLLLCTYFLLKEKPFWAMVAFGLAISFKAQAVFLVPFLGIMFLKRRIAWYHFLVVPVVYLLLGIPAAIIGRSWQSIITIYAGQVDQFQKLAMNAPNLYMFIPNTYYSIVVKAGMVFFVICMAWWGWINWRAKVVLTDNKILLIALTGLALVPFLLPKMHERYFFPVDVFSYVVAIFNPELWLLPILYQVISGLAYTNYLFGLPDDWVKIVAILNAFTVVYILYKQLRSLREAEPKQIPVAAD